VAYTTIDDPEAYFQSVLWTGNGSNPRTITLGGDTNLQPDIIWYKCRSHAVPNILYDSVRGFGNDKEVSTNDGLAQGAQSSETDGFITAVTSDGFTLAAGGSGGDHYTNEGSRTFIAWCWKESADAGFDIVSYTGNGTDDTDISHSLSAVPHVIIVKNRAEAYGWNVYHHKNTSAPETDVLSLDTNAATYDTANSWSDEAPTSSVFTLGAGNGVNKNTNTMIAYLFTGKQGFSKFGGYTGNGSADGPYIHLGFKPAFIMTKRTDSTNQWIMLNNKMSTENDGTGDELYGDLNVAQNSFTDGGQDFLSNGFKCRGTNASINYNGGTYVYMAFAESPFVNSNGVPNNAK